MGRDRRSSRRRIGPTLDRSGWRVAACRRVRRSLRSSKPDRAASGPTRRRGSPPASRSRLAAASSSIFSLSSSPRSSRRHRASAAACEIQPTACPAPCPACADACSESLAALAFLLVLVVAPPIENAVEERMHDLPHAMDLHPVLRVAEDGEQADRFAAAFHVEAIEQVIALAARDRQAEMLGGDVFGDCGPRRR